MTADLSRGSCFDNTLPVQKTTAFWGRCLPEGRSLRLSATQSPSLSFAFGARPTHPAESLKRLEILHTTIRGVCPSRFASPRSGQSHSNFMRRRRLISNGALSSDSGLFELVASRLGSSAG